MPETPDLSLLNSQFLQFGGDIFKKNVNEFDAASQGIMVMKNIQKPTALTKLSAQGGPRPYRAQDDTTGNGVAFTDRILTVRNSKWDFDIDPEKFLNTYLATNEDVPFYQHIIDQVSTEYMAQINDLTAWEGVYNLATGTTASDIADGWKVPFKAAALAGDLHAVVTTGAITLANVLASVKNICSAVPAWMRKKGFRVKCSYAVFDLYAQAYATAYGFQFTPDATGKYRINNFKAFLEPETWLDNDTNAVFATVDNNLVLGTDALGIQVHSSVRRNIIEMRLMMDVGFQFQDGKAIVANDIATT